MELKETVERKHKLEKRYIGVSKLFLLFGFIYFIWTVFIIISTYYLGFGNNWAALTMDEWILSSVAILSLLIIFELLFVVHHFKIKKDIVELGKPRPTFFKGKRLHVYTIPEDSKGGIYGKTYIKLDENNVLSIRYQLIPPYDLWGKKE